MSQKYPGGIITKNPTAPTTSSAKGIWTLDQAQQYTKQGIWPRSPGAPTIGTASISSGSTTASVSFTAPTDLGAGSINYTATSSPGGLSGTGTSPISVSGLTVGTAYTFSVTGTTPGGTGPSSAASNSITPTAVVGQQAYTTAGTYSWVAPSGVTSISAVAVGAGGNGNTGYYGGCCAFYPSLGAGGGGLGYKNNYSVTPGSSYTVVVGDHAASNAGSGQDSYFVSTAVLKGGGGGGGNMSAGTPGTYTGTGGGNGGSGGGSACSPYAGGGGGAGGYAGAGGNGGANSNGSAGSGGAGGGGAGATAPGAGTKAYGGGGVGILGQGTSGAASSSGGNGGSSGGNGALAAAATVTGGLYGGGGPSSNVASLGAGGAVRIIWPGTTRSFPSTCTGNL